MGGPSPSPPSPLTYALKEPPRADRNQVQLSRGGFWSREKSRAAVAPGWFPRARSVTSRHVYSSFTRPKGGGGRENTCENGGRGIVLCECKLETSKSRRRGSPRSPEERVPATLRHSVLLLTCPGPPREGGEKEFLDILFRKSLRSAPLPRSHEPPPEGYAHKRAARSRLF